MRTIIGILVYALGITGAAYTRAEVRSAHSQPVELPAPRDLPTSESAPTPAPLVAAN